MAGVAQPDSTRPMITHDELTKLFRYKPDTGEFVRRIKLPSSHFGPGSVAGAMHQKTGYWVIKINKRYYLAHRLAWFYMTGKWPSSYLDHINGRKIDNRFSNLREVTNSQNQQNRGARSNSNRTGLLGVRVHRAGYRSSIKIDGKSFDLGCFASKEEATAAYWAAKTRLHPFSAIPFADLPVLRDIQPPEA